ncbi:alpha/beta fold hydrolase [Burkholderia glumae]|uniref:alpha/beta fold hydrolase n=1 Tax=Burkholderia glumae TaxID=337 RepID=UPI000C27BEA7|nr:alpha/beta fold hydrolase [Burkholderia glumae]PJO21502.1 alpha/beta hydrolase [Burkholderia glumae AU6208]QHE12551.1 alpha/beta fold hydrolase [Burkholderia glumae AU6208]
MSHRPPVILIQGFIGSLDAIASGHPDLLRAAPDLLGYGAYRHVPFEAISLPEQVEHIRSFIAARTDAPTVDLVGHSTGGAIAMLFAHAYPDRVRRIVNVEGNFTLDDAFWSAPMAHLTPAEADARLASLRAQPAAWLRCVVRDVTPAMADTAARWLDRQPASTLRAMGQSVIAVTGNAGYAGKLRQVFQRHPVYLLSGERSHDNWHLPGWAVELCAGREVLADCGHLMMLEAPAAFSAAIEGFLSRPEA